MDNINVYKKHLHNYILSLASHPYVRRYLPEPIVDDEKLHLLILLLNDIDLTDQERDQIIAATMLVQIALDIHDHIPASTTINDGESLQEHQLTVLAGDYYSGLYYYILSKLERIELIRLLAEGIKDINEKKMILQQSAFADEEALYSAVLTIQSSLVLKVAECFSKSQFREFIEQYLLMCTLIKHREHFIAQEDSFLFDSLSCLIFNKPAKNLVEHESNELLLSVDKRIAWLHSACSQSLLTSFSPNSSLYRILQATLTENELKESSYAEEG
ncbi:MAG: heptaprenyl diphosphate synthase component 1 [Bacillus sp. (in: firmicutes)]